MKTPNDASLRVTVDPAVRGEIKRLRQALGDAYSPRTLRKFENVAMLNAARTLVRPIRSMLPKDSGLMARSVKARRGKYRRPSAIVGPKQKGATSAYYARFVLRSGAAAHRIPKRSDKLVRLSTPYGVFTEVQHPGMRPSNAVTRAAEANLDDARLAFGRTITKLINDQEFRGKVAGLQAKYAGRTRP